MRVVQNTRQIFSINQVFSGIPAGTYAFGMCGTGDANWNSNEFGYVSTLVFN